jgi:hypothetical protein
MGSVEGVRAFAPLVISGAERVQERLRSSD